MRMSFKISDVVAPHCVPTDLHAVTEEDRMIVKNICNCVAVVDTARVLSPASVRKTETGYEVIFPAKEGHTLDISYSDLASIHNTFPLRIQSLRIIMKNGMGYLKIVLSNSRQPMYFDEFQIETVRKKRRFFG